MPQSYLERYQNGEHEQVWRELVALGSAIRHEPIADDAVAVAREMMRRARQNIALLVQRLRVLGYQFVAEQSRPQQLDLAQVLQNITAQAESLHGPGSPDFYPELQRMAESMQQRMTGLADELRQQFQQLQAEHGITPPVASRPDGPWIPADDAFQSRVAEFDRTYGPLPVVLRAWYEVVGCVDLVGDHPQLSRYYHDGPSSDPLVVYFDSDGFIGAIEEDARIDRHRRLYPFEIAPDACHKANMSGGGPLYLKVPNPGFDGPLVSDDPWDRVFFVPYLRTCFQWGGFPGLQYDSEAAARAQELLALLTQDLLPI